jgi:hypothetical protein
MIGFGKEKARNHTFEMVKLNEKPSFEMQWYNCKNSQELGTGGVQREVIWVFRFTSKTSKEFGEMSKHTF